MPVVLTALCEDAVVGPVCLGVEHDTALALAADAFALEVVEMD
jgi:hypothetical protein